jgi:SH3 domain protein
MRRIAIVGVCLLLVCSNAQAETKYVGDLMEITFRTGPGTDHKITAMLKSGQKLEVIQEEENWTKVRLPSEKEGWVWSRYISADPPSSLLLQGLKEKNKVLTLQAASLLEENARIKAKNENLAGELAINEENRIKLKEANAILEKKSGGKTAEQVDRQNMKIEKLEEEITSLQRNHNIKWFLSGAGVLVLGFLIGFSAKRQKRRSTLL